jgi:Domain of unknown function (DUF4352)
MTVTLLGVMDMSADDSGFPQVSFGQPENGSGHQQGPEPPAEVPPSTWLPTPPPVPPRSGYGYGGPQWGQDYTPGYGAGGTGAGTSRYNSGGRYGSGYGPDFGPGPNMGPVRTILAYAGMRWQARRRRRRWIAFLAVILVWGVIGVISAVVSSSGDSGDSGDPSVYNAPSGVVKGTAGQALTLYGFESGEKMSVTLTKVIPGAQPGDQFSAPGAGDQLYAVQFKLANTGSAAYDDAPSNGTKLVDSAGKSYSPTFMVDSVTGCPMFAAVEQIAAGGAHEGCLAFQIPATAKITEVRFTLDSGLASQTGQWTVAG